MNERPSPSPALKTLPRRGLTLIELLITMVLVSIVMAGIYAMLGSSSEVFHHQELTAESQTRLRFATRAIKQDLLRAGHNVSPNSATDIRVCPKPPQPITAVSIRDRGLVVSGAGQTIDYDELNIAGDFSGHPGLRIQRMPNTSTIVISRQSILQGQAKDVPADQAGAVLAQLVAPDQWLAVKNPDQVAQYVKVADVDEGQLAIRLQTPLVKASEDGLCGVTGMVDEMHEVHPLQAVRYSLALDPDDPTGRNSQLVRDEIDLQTGAVTPSRRLVIADNVVGMRFAVIGTDGTDSGVALEPDDALLDLDSGTGTGSVLDPVILENNPQRARFVLYRIQTRTSRAVPQRLAVPDSALTSNDADLMYFSLDDKSVAEVRTLQGKVELPTFLHLNPR